MTNFCSKLARRAPVLSSSAAPRLALSILIVSTVTVPAVYADDDVSIPSFSVSGATHHDSGPRADGHAPIGVMGDHMHQAGEWMLSYRYMSMSMEGNRIGQNGASPDSIVTTVPNRFAGAPMQPPTLRVVPTRMDMDMHMFGAMYAPTDNLTLMAMMTYVEKDMDHITYMGPAGTMRRGTFSTSASGLGDTKLSGLFRLYDDDIHHWHAGVGLSLPTGDLKQRGRVLAPNGMTPTLRLPYAMQLGTGTFDLLPSLTYSGRVGDWSWGAQLRSEIRLEESNDEGYAWGDKHAVTGWLQYQWAPRISTSLRVEASTQADIDGIDMNIVAPVQTANPDFFGGETVALFGGINLVGQSGAIKGHRLALEVGAPVYQDLNGPQLETDWTFMLGWQKAF